MRNGGGFVGDGVKKMSDVKVGDYLVVNSNCNTKAECEKVYVGRIVKEVYEIMEISENKEEILIRFWFAPYLGEVKFGDVVEVIGSTNQADYPDDGPRDGWWYEKID